MVHERGFRGSPDHFRHLVAQHRPRRPAEAYLRLRSLPGEQALAVGRECQRAVLAGEQGHAQVVFQCAHLAAHGGLGDEALGRGPFAADAAEAAELAQGGQGVDGHQEGLDRVDRQHAPLEQPGQCPRFVRHTRYSQSPGYFHFPRELRSHYR